MSRRTDAAPRTPARGGAFARVAAGLVFGAAVAALALAAAWPVYRTPWLAVTAGGAVLAAILIAAISARRGWTGWPTAVVVAGAFLLLGVPLAVPTRTGDPASFARGLAELASGVVTGPKDLVTVDLPVGVYRNLLVPAFLVFLVGTVVLLRLAWRADHAAYAAVPVAIGMVSFGLLFGAATVSDPLSVGSVVLYAPVETAIGAGTLLTCLLWLAWRGHDERERALARAVAGSGVRPYRRSSGVDRRRTALGAGMIVTALAAAVAVVPFAARGAERDVLREAAGPELAMSRAVSPLVDYRSLFADDRARAELFTVSSQGPAPERVRLATLDEYDGSVFRSGTEGAAADARFVRVPAMLDARGAGAADLEIRIAEWSGIWMPTVAGATSVGFDGPRASALADGFYYNRDAAAGVQTAGGGLAPGDVVRIEASVIADPELQTLVAPGAPASAVPAPEALRTWTDRHANGTDGAALAGLVDLLRERGYLSHALTAGEEPAVWTRSLGDYAFQPSAAGHSLARIQTMFTRLLERETDPRAAANGSYVAAVGDDEQFATAVALIARELGFPARVVVGVRLHSDDPGLAVCEDAVCRGEDVAAWTEVQSADGTWAPIDVTPQHEVSPALDVTEQRDPENVTDVRPDAVEEVVPPEPLQEDTVRRDDETATTGPDLAWLWPVLRIAGILSLALLVLIGPFAVVLAAKASRRRSRRRAPTPAARVAGGWDEYVDAAVDAGREAPRRLTRPELAAAFGTAHGGLLAVEADRAVFSGSALAAEDAAAFWRVVDGERRALARSRGFWRRIAMTVSLRSFIRQLAPSGTAKRLAERGKRRAIGLARTSP
ncbi:transglutaminase-like domain-containing protein [Microbacterium sp. ARD31]|uniref:transglutaminase-like domain-containing protein n=1 Tax=Microbacterium sp. ARD31 TaxID=2962576 RepID=UPI0028811ABA|nr:transglutaminase-like domain-containing protein [Microbacterium sp. ARD31]MDT0185074.1 transglutaminase-like domain-containing protein [Microbacterium sp. ARD31]